MTAALRNTALLSAACLVLAGATYLALHVGDHGARSGEAPSLLPDAFPRMDFDEVSAISVGSGPMIPVFLSPGFSQAMIFGWELDLEGPRMFAVREITKTGPGIVEQETAVFFYGTLYDILNAASAGRDRFYLVGSYDDGDACVERWSERRPVPKARGAAPVMARTQLYRGMSLGAIRCIGADPEERYVLLMHGSPLTLSQVDGASGAITFLFDETTVPALARMRYLAPWEHATEGRVWILESADGTGTPTVLLYDPENDGAIHRWIALDAEAWCAAGYNNPKVWVDNFMHG